MLVVGVANTNNSIILNTEPEFWKPHSLYNKHDCTFGIHTFSDVYTYIYTLHTLNTCTLRKSTTKMAKAKGWSRNCFRFFSEINDTCRGFPADHVANPQISGIIYSPMEAQLATSKTC